MDTDLSYFLQLILSNKINKMIKGTNLNRLLSVSIQLAAEACEIVKKFYVDQNAKQYKKGFNDCVTEVMICEYRPIIKFKLCLSMGLGLIFQI